MQPRRLARLQGSLPSPLRLPLGAIARVAVVGSVGFIAMDACAGGLSEPTPEATLPSSPQSAMAFEEIRTMWNKAEGADPAGLAVALEHFLARFPNDGLVPLARVYLAIVAMQQGELDAADRQLAATATLPPGTAHDLWTVARARRIRLRGDPEAALELLRALVGKNVDPVTRAVFEEELTLTALATHRDYEAISYMDAWVRASSEEEKSRTVAKVICFVEQLPKDVLVGSLQAMRAQRATLGYGVDIERILAERLAKIATQSGDAELARMLLDPDAGALVIGGDAGLELSELATSRRGLHIVQGRTVGVLLPSESPGLRDETADVLRGVLWALGLPRGLRRHEAQPAVRDGGTPAIRSGCAPLETAPALRDPEPEEGLRLVTRDDAGNVDRTEVSLDELAGEGAGVVIAGLDPQTAARALSWSQSQGVAVIALAPPTAGIGMGSFGFVLGEPRESVLLALTREAPALATGRVAPLIDVSEVSRYPAAGGPVGPLSLLPPISCDIPPTRAGDPRFPITEWDHEKTRAWLVSGSPRCARDLVGELTAAHERGVVALTLEAATLPPRPPGLRVVSASSGIVPSEVTNGLPEEDELRRFSAALGNVTWWTALGRDAATLARLALRTLPADTATEPPAIAERRTAARDLLASAHTRLWTTEKTTWTDAHTMSRTVCAVEAPSK
ncbi:MAG: hypothetical protein WBY94_27500 [Polyangiaceae bacterium]